MEAIKYTLNCYEGVIAMAHDMGQKSQRIFVPELKLTFDNNWNVWKTETLEIRASRFSIWSEEELANPKLANKIKESQEREQAEIDQIKKTIKHIIISPESVEYIKQLYLIGEQKKAVQAKLKELGFPV